MNLPAITPLKRAEPLNEGLFKHDIEVTGASGLIGAGAGVLCP